MSAAIVELTPIVGVKAACEALNTPRASFSASSAESVGEGERQRALSVRNRWNFRHVESNDLCWSSSP